MSKPDVPRPGWTYTRNGHWLPRLTRAERAERDARILHMYSQSMSQTVIAEIIGCAQPTVNRVIRLAAEAAEAAKAIAS